MKETLSYDVLTVMQEKKGKSLTADGRKGEFSEQYYDYRGVHKRLCDLVANGCAMRAGATDDGLLLYQVSEKGLLINSFDDYKKAVYKPRTPKPKKTREESAVKKECKKGNKAGSFMPDGKNKLIGGDVFKKECKMIGTGDISSLERWENGGNMGIGGDASNHSPRSPPVGYTAGTQITTTHRNEQGDIAIGYYPSGRVTQTGMIPTLRDGKIPLFAERKEEAKQPRYKRLRSAFTRV